jgi:hypothetical protein
MAERKALSKKIRFEVFKRDAFTCQYCGRKAPDVLLVIDHIEPVAKGGKNNILNLVTSCRDCNAGKSDRQLDDTTVLDKQRRQLAELQERREQIDMMFQWQKGLIDIGDQMINQLSEYWSELVPGYQLNDNSLKGLKKLQRKFELGEIMAAMKIAADHYLKYKDDTPTKESVEVAWKKVGGICTMRRIEKEKPELAKLYYIRNIIRKRCGYVDEAYAMQLLQEALDAGISTESLERHAKNSDHWTQWQIEINEYIEKNKENKIG